MTLCCMWCVQLMPDLFFNFYGQNNARYLTQVSVFTANVKDSHHGATHLLNPGVVNVNRPFGKVMCLIDKTMEELFMKFAESHSGAGESGTRISGTAGSCNSYQ